MDSSPLERNWENWSRIVNGAQGFTRNKKFLNLSAQIPFLSLDIDIRSFYYLWLELYPLVMNLNSNAIELIIDDNKEIINSFLHKSNNEGMYIEVLKIDVNKLPDISEKMENVDQIFNILRVWVKKTHNVDIGNIRIIPYNLLNDFGSIFKKYSELKPGYGFLEMIGEYIDVIVLNHNQNLLKCYPSSPLFDFFSKLDENFVGFSYFNIMSAIREYLPNIKLTMTFKMKDNSTFLSYFVKISKSKINFELITIPESILSEKNPTKQEKKLFKLLKKDCNTNLNLIFQLKEIEILLNEIINTPFPIQKERLILIEEKFINFYRSIGNSWNMDPKPYIYNNSFRFWIYLFGFYINPRKLSFWSLPSIMQSFLSMFFSLTGEILFLKSDKFLELNNIDSKNNITGYIFSMNDGIIEKIKSIRRNELFNFFKAIKVRNDEKTKEDNNKKYEYDKSKVLSQIRDEFSNEFTFVSSVIWLNNTMISKLFSILLLDFHRASRFSGRKIVRILSLFRKNKYFSVFPENPLYKSIKKQNSLQLLKRTAPIFTDLHEF
ncbi:MAG: hypothetical protein DRO88_07335 [Promethearchaeia archaeon]|nr:MAG: hypothetical protein DRO88_07335 [Candidatus Lokiarchaeia archaeon]